MPHIFEPLGCSIHGPTSSLLRREFTVNRRLRQLWVPVAIIGAFALGAGAGYSVGERELVVEVEESPSLLTDDEVRGSDLEPDPGPDPASEEAIPEFVDVDPATIYVSPSGDDALDGQTPQTAFGSLGRAVAEVQPGMTLFVMEGEHIVEGEGPTLLPLVREGTPDQWTRILGFGDSRPVIIARGGALFEALGSYIEISGLELRGEGFDVDNSYGYGVLLGDGHHFRVVDNVVSGFPVSGIGAVRTSHIFIADNVVFENSYWGTEQGSGLSVFHATNYGFADDEFGYSDYFINNTVFGNENRVTSRFVEGKITDGNGIIIDNADETGYLGRTLIANNVIHSNGGRGIWAYASSRVDIFNNTTFSNVRTGVALNDGRAEIATVDGQDVRIINNVAWNGNGMETFIVDSSDGIVVSTNVAVGGAITGFDGDGIVVFEESSQLFNSIDGNAPDLGLPTGSPLIDGGESIVLPLDSDIAGTPRVSGPAIDIGAFEFSG